jgi:hypothetical protein
MSLVLQSSGGGSVTIAEPTTASNFTQTLPAVNGTVLTTGNIPAGSVLQVVSQNYTTNFESTTTSFADTGITVSITPTSATSKILVLITLGGVYKDGSDTLTGLQARLVRNSTTIQQFGNRVGFNSSTAPNYVGLSFNFLDSPATTSSTIYKIQAANKASASKVAININGPDDASSITLLEIAA